jgi:hypothetical protein
LQAEAPMPVDGPYHSPGTPSVVDRQWRDAWDWFAPKCLARRRLGVLRYGAALSYDYVALARSALAGYASTGNTERLVDAMSYVVLAWLARPATAYFGGAASVARGGVLAADE